MNAPWGEIIGYGLLILAIMESSRRYDKKIIAEKKALSARVNEEAAGITDDNYSAFLCDYESHPLLLEHIRTIA